MNKISFVLPSGITCLADYEYQPTEDYTVNRLNKETFPFFEFKERFIVGKFSKISLLKEFYPPTAIVLTKQDLDFINNYEFKLPGKQFTANEMRDAVGFALWGEHYNPTPAKNDDFGFATHSGDFNGDDSE